MAFSFVLAAAEAGSANPVSFHLWTFLFQALNVLIVMGGLYVLLFRPLGAIMKKREAYVESSLAQASTAKAEAERLLAEYREQMQNARREAQEIIEKSAREAREYEKQRMKEADAKYEELLAKAKAELEAERQKALAAVKDDVVNLAILAASHVLGRTLKEEDHHQLVRDFVEKIGDVQ